MYVNVCMYVCMYVCLFVCMYVCLYVCMYVCMYVCVYLCIYVSMYLCIYVSMYLCIYVSMYVSMYLCIYVSMYLCIYVCMNEWMYECMNVWMYECKNVRMYECMYECMNVWMYECMNVWMHACMHVCGWMDASMHVCMSAFLSVCLYVCMHAWMDACMYVCMYILGDCITPEAIINQQVCLRTQPLLTIQVAFSSFCCSHGLWSRLAPSVWWKTWLGKSWTKYVHWSEKTMKKHETHLINKGFSVAIFVDVLLWRWFGNWWFSVTKKVLGTWPTETWGNSMCFKEKERDTGLVGGFNHLEKYEFVNGKDDIPYMKWKIKAMFETTNQGIISLVVFLPEHPQLLDLLVTVSLSHYWNLRCHDFSVCEPSKAVLVVSHESIATKQSGPVQTSLRQTLSNLQFSCWIPHLLTGWLVRVSTDLRSSMKFTGWTLQFYGSWWLLRVGLSSGSLT